MYEKDDDSGDKRIKVMGAFESDEDNSARVPLLLCRLYNVSNLLKS